MMCIEYITHDMICVYFIHYSRYDTCIKCIPLTVKLVLTAALSFKDFCLRTVGGGDLMSNLAGSLEFKSLEPV